MNTHALETEFTKLPKSPLPHCPKSNEPFQIQQTMKQFSGFAGLLRIGGALTIIAAMSMFLLQGWQEGDDISRYYMLLTQTLLLAACGFGLSFLFRENKGGRVFFGLGLISITVNMTTLGALIFSTMQWGSGLADYPDFARWQAVDIGTILIALAATLAASAPIAYFSHKVMARQSANLLTGIFLCMNLLLLLPVRESALIGLVAIIATLAPIWCIRTRLSEDISLRTAEGIFAIATLLLPGAIIILRTLWLYPVDELLLLMLSGVAYLALRILSLHTDKQMTVHRLTNLLSVAAALGIACASLSLLESVVPDSMHAPLFALPLALLLLDIGKRSKSPKDFQHAAIFTLASLHILPAVLGVGGFSGLLCVFAGMGVIAIGYHNHISRGITVGGVTIALGLLVQFKDILQTIDFSDWITLSITGALIIIIASLIERHGAYLKLKWQQRELPGLKS
jgi:hypothetical protein